MLLTVEHKILVALLDGPLQNSHVAKRVGITEQWCSQIMERLHRKGLVESEFKPPRRINRLTERGVEIATRLKEVSENLNKVKEDVI